MKEKKRAYLSTAYYSKTFVSIIHHEDKISSSSQIDLWIVEFSIHQKLLQSFEQRSIDIS